MPEYVTRASIAWDDCWETPQATTFVVIEDSDARNTGLLDANGNKLYRVRERQPMGFRLR